MKILLKGFQVQLFPAFYSLYGHIVKSGRTGAYTVSKNKASLSTPILNPTLNASAKGICKSLEFLTADVLRNETFFRVTVPPSSDAGRKLVYGNNT